MPSKTVPDEREEQWRAISTTLKALRRHPDLRPEIKSGAMIYREPWDGNGVPRWADYLEYLYERYEVIWRAMPALGRSFVHDALLEAIKAGGDWKAVEKGFETVYRAVRSDTHKPYEAIVGEVLWYDRNAHTTNAEQPVYSEYPELLRNHPRIRGYADYERELGIVGDDSHAVVTLHVYGDASLSEFIQNAREIYREMKKRGLVRSHAGTPPHGGRQPNGWAAEVGLYAERMKSDREGYSFKDFVARVQTGKIAIPGFPAPPKSAHDLTEKAIERACARTKWLCPRDDSEHATFDAYLSSLHCLRSRRHSAQSD